MPAPGGPTAQQSPAKVTLASYVMGEEMIPRAEAAVDYGELPFYQRWIQEALIKCVQKYGVRIALKWTSKILAGIGGSALAVESHEVAGFVSVIMAIIVGAIEQGGSYFAKKRYERKLAQAKPAKATVAQ